MRTNEFVPSNVAESIFDILLLPKDTERSPGSPLNVVELILVT
jgi:hypothetical protein